MGADSWEAGAMHTRSQALLAVAAGAASLLLGLSLFYITLVLEELAILLGTNLVVDDQIVSYVAPWPLYLMPVALAVIGIVLMIVPIVWKRT